MRVSLILAIAIALLLALARTAHGDVTHAAHDALRTGDFSLIAVWVEPADEPALARAFHEARARRPARDAAFIATAQRLHGARLAVDCDVQAAIESGDEEAIVAAVVTELRAGLRRRAREVAVLRDHPRGDIDAGRAAVDGYLDLVQYAASVLRAARVPPPPPVAPIRHER